MLNFQAVAEKMAKPFRGLLFFVAPCILCAIQMFHSFNT